MRGTSCTSILFLAASLALLTGSTACYGGDDDALECGDVRASLDTKRQSIVNGDPTWDPSVVPLSEGQALAVGAMMMDLGAGWEPLCTGTLVSPTVALLAAHCVVDQWGNRESAANLRFGIGTDTEALRATLAPSQILVDSLYGSGGGTAEHDQAALVFANPVTDTVPTLVPIPANRVTLSAAQVIGEDVQTVGFGCTDADCNFWNSERWWAVEELVALSSFDLTVDGHGVAGVCFGDSGGPVLRNVPGAGVHVLGTLSWGDPACTGEDHFALTDANGHFLDPLLPDCGAVTLAGSCSGSRAIYCESDVLVSVECSASGKECRLEGGLSRCLDPVPVGCGAVTAQGSCSGSVATYCETNAVITRDCASTGEICRADGGGYHRCAAASSCGAVTNAGSCDGNLATYCESGAVTTVDCAAGRRICQADASGLHRCVDPCAGETLQGRCEGDDAIWCEDGAIKVRRCAECGLGCGFSDALGVTDCL